MLHVLIVENIFSGSDIIVTLIVSIEIITHIEHVRLVKTTGQPCASAEIARPVTSVDRRVALMKIVTGLSCECESIGNAKREFIFEVPLMVTVDLRTVFSAFVKSIIRA